MTIQPARNPQDAPPSSCAQCGEEISPLDVHAGWGMCGPCTHDALRSGWEPPAA